MNKRSQKFPFSYLNLENIPDDISGVYAFWNRQNSKCIYVGKAERIKRRLKDHWRHSHNEKLNLWIKAFGAHLDVCYVTDAIDKIGRLEKRLIKMWYPKANTQYKQ